MKRNIAFFVMLLGLAGLLATQSCKKTAGPEPKLYEAAMPSAPVPAVGGVLEFTGAGQSVPLTWTATATAAPKWDVYFGPSEDAMDMIASNVSGNAYTVTVDEGGLYYWQVVTTDANGVETESPVWHFDVNSNPDVPVLTPAAGATGVSTSVALTWTHTDPEGDALKYDVYFGTTSTPGPVATGLTAATYSPAGLGYTTKYYWKVVAKDPYGGVATSPVDSFTTGAYVPDFSVFNGKATEKCPSISGSTKTFTTQIITNTTTHEIVMFLPVADAMVYAGWGTAYTGTHAIKVTYDPTTFVLTGATQAWCDSFIDPTEMGPMTLAVAAGSTIDVPNKKLTIKWTIDGNAYWGGAYTPSQAATYVMQ